MRYSLLVLLVTVSGCGASDTTAPAQTEQPVAAVSAPAYQPGQRLIVLKDRATCIDVGDRPDPEPWEMAKGALVEFVRTEGAELIVESAPGMPCRIAASAVEPV